MIIKSTLVITMALSISNNVLKIVIVVITLAIITSVIYIYVIQERGVDDKKIVIVVNPLPKDEVIDEARELENYLENVLDVDVEIIFPTNVAAIIESLRFGHAQVALGIGSLTAAIAMEVADVEMPLAEVRKVIIDGEVVEKPYYFSYWIVRYDSPYSSLEDLRGARVCFPSELSTSGYIFPLYRLVQLGYLEAPADPKNFFGDVVIGGGYAQCWEALKNGNVDVTVIAGDVPENLFREAMDNSRVIEMQGPLPSHVVLVSSDLDEELKRKIVDALIGLNDRPELMKKFVSAIFVRFEERTSEEHLKPLIEALKDTGLIEKYLKEFS